MGKWIVIAVVAFLAFRVVDKVDFGNASLPGAGKPGISVTSGGKTLPTAAPRASQPASQPAASNEVAAEEPTVMPTAVPAPTAVPVNALPTAVIVQQPVSNVVQPSQEQLDAATKPLVEAATAAAEAHLPPPLPIPTAIPTGQGYHMVSAPNGQGGEMKYGVVATRPDGSQGVIWNLRGVPLSDGAQKELAGLIMTGLVRGDDAAGL